LAHEEQVQLLPLPSPLPLAPEEHEVQLDEPQSQLLPLAHDEQAQLSPWPLALEEHEAQVHELQSQLSPLAQEVHEL